LPSGPFVSIADRPIDYFPFDPSYHDVNLLMSPPYLTPSSTHAAGHSAPLGTYIPSIDPNVVWDDEGQIWLFFSRNAYRNWVWSDEFDKYIEESNIYAVQLDDTWWNDIHAKTLPTVHASFRNIHKGEPEGWVINLNASYTGPTRKDGWVAIISYKLQPQVRPRPPCAGCGPGSRDPASHDRSGKTRTSMTTRQAAVCLRTADGPKAQPPSSSSILWASPCTS
jgi:hypothetical protein